MELFAPTGLPGVGMGDLLSITGVGGLVALATTSGALVAEGIVGTLIYLAAAIAVLAQKPDLGGHPGAVTAVLVVVGLAAGVRVLLEGRGRAALAATGAGAADAIQTGTGPRRGPAGWPEALAVAVAGLSVGYAWAEWNEAPFAFADREAVAGLLLGLACATIGAYAAHIFIVGSVRAGGHAAIVGAAVIVAAGALNIAGFYVPFVGYLALFSAVVVSLRLRRRAQRKYKGLRILS